MQAQFASILSRFYRVSTKVNMVITPVLHEILVGSMLGVQCFTTSTGSNPTAKKKRLTNSLGP